MLIDLSSRGAEACQKRGQLVWGVWLMFAVWVPISFVGLAVGAMLGRGGCGGCGTRARRRKRCMVLGPPPLEIPVAWVDRVGLWYCGGDRAQWYRGAHDYEFVEWCLFLQLRRAQSILRKMTLEQIMAPIRGHRRMQFRPLVSSSNFDGQEHARSLAAKIITLVSGCGKGRRH